LVNQLAQLSTDWNSAGLARLECSFVFAEDDRSGDAVNVGNRRPAQFARARTALGIAELRFWRNRRTPLSKRRQAWRR
jgi:hypothetical protein